MAVAPQSRKIRPATLAVAAVADSRELASASNDQTVRTWDSRTGKERLRLIGHQGVVHGVAYSPDGRTLASGGVDGTVRLWHVASGGELLMLTPGACFSMSLMFSPDGRYLTALRQPYFGADHVIDLWDAGEWLPPLRRE